jgi:predicted DNA-binding protein (MmcQ/YjbR family)
MGSLDRERSARELELIERVRSICAELGLPEVETVIDGFGHTTFRVAKKSFVMIGGGEGDGSLSIKADHATQAVLVRRGPYVRTPYIGQHGWVTAWGDVAIDWEEVQDLISDAYRLAAPRRLLRKLDE